MTEALWLPDDSGLAKGPLRPGDLAKLAAYLRAQRTRVLARRTVDEIVEVLDGVAARWLEPGYPLRREAVSRISDVAGFSTEMVAHAIELEQLSSRKADLLATLDGELGDRHALDGFVQTPKGTVTAVGPELIGGIFSANIPALPHLTVMRSFLVKAACLGRVSRGEPVYLPLYARSIAEVDPELASCLAVVHWDSADTATEAEFMGAIDHLIAYGGDSALASLRSRWPQLSATWHGHRMGFAWIGRAALPDAAAADVLAERIAYDFSVFDQHACLAPQACFVEAGGPVSPVEFAERLATHMAHWLGRLPPRRLTVETAASLRRALDEATLDDVMGGETRVLTPGDRLQGTVIVQPVTAFLPSPLDRFARVVPLQGPQALIELLTPVRRYLQCAAIAGADGPLKRRLAELGVTRLCPPGAMGTPSMLWHHDGRACVAELVRWCDEETRPPG